MKNIGFALVVCFLITSCGGYRTPPGAVISAPLPKSKLSAQQRENLTESDIAFLIQRGDEEYANGNYTAAKSYYYEVLLAVPNPSAYVLVSYGSCLANLGLYKNAIEIFNRALEKDPYNETARKNITVCEHFIEQEAETQRQIQEDQERFLRENMQNLASTLTELSEQTQKNKKTKGLSAPLATMGKMTRDYQKVEDILQNIDSLGTLNEQNVFAILDLLDDATQKNKSNRKLSNTISSLNKIAHGYKVAQNVAENLDSPSELLNEDNMILILASVGKMAQKNQDNKKIANTLSTLGKVAKEYKRVRDAAGNLNLDEQNVFAILDLLDDAAQKNQGNKKLSNTLSSLNKIAQGYKTVQNATENLNSSSELLNEQNTITFLNLLGEMAQKNQNKEKLNSTLNSLSKIAKEYERGQNAAENEQNLITILNSLNEMAQEYQNKQR